jgi:hypothetical protein
MSSKQFNAASRLATIASRTQELEYKEVKVPVPDDDFMSKFKDASGPRTKRTNEWIIDTMPNFLAIMLFVIYECNKYIGSLDPKSHAKVSAVTLVAYCMNVVYAHFLISDIYTRSPPSRHASAIMSNYTYEQYVYYLASLPVPNFLVPILKTFVATSTPRRPNVVFVPSFNGFIHHWHFGKIFPVNMFTLIHDIASESNARSDPNQVYLDIMTSPVYKIGQTFEATIGKLLSTLVPDRHDNPTVNRYLNNKVTQSFRSLFNPVLLRAYQQKQTFAPINLEPFKAATFNYNPYLMALSLTHKNVHELKTLFTSISSTFKGIISCDSDLAGIYKNLSGISILTHGYSAYALPTFHYTTGFFPTAARVAPLPTEDFAALIVFKQRHDQADFAAQTNTRPVCDNNPEHHITIQPRTMLVENADMPAAADRHPSANDFHLYDDEYDLYPRVRLLNPFEEDTVSAPLTTLCGMVIEADELEASTVPHPNELVELGIENSQFLGSAIPFRKVRAHTDYYVTGQNYDFNHRHYYPIANRATIIASSPPAATLLRNPTLTYLPYVVRDARYLGLSALHYGFTHVRNVSFAQFYQTFLGFTVRDNTNARHVPGVHAPSHTPAERLQVWSPYVYVARSFDEEWTDVNDTSVSASIYFITNLRTFFGTDPGLIELESAFAAMPIS